MRRWSVAPPAHRLAGLAALALAAVLLTACGPPSYRFTASDADDLVVKVPRSWNLVNSGVPPNSDGTPAEAGNWFAVYDADGHPSLEHVGAAHVSSPVALVRTLVVPKETGQSATDDDLRDFWLPVSAKARADAASKGFIGTSFSLDQDEHRSTKAATGVHVRFSYNLGDGREVFEQVAMKDKSNTRVHFFLVHCTKACYDSNHQAIAEAMRSFTVRLI
jgi:hypothetical protein